MHRCPGAELTALQWPRRNRRPRLWTARALLAIGTVVVLASRGAAAPACPQTNLGNALPTSISGTTEGASNALTGSCGGDGPEATFLYTAPTTGAYVLDTGGSEIDTVLYVLDASCAGQELGCNDDFEGTLSQVTVNLTAGQSVVVVVDSIGAGGPFTLHIAPVDTMPPELTALSFPARVDLSTEPATIAVSYSATDDGSGVAFFEMKFAVPGVGCGVGSFDDFPPVLSRTGAMSIDLPEDAPTGVYAVCEAYLCDAQDNCRDYTANELTALGLPTAVTVVRSLPGNSTPTATPKSTTTGTPPVTATPTDPRNETVSPTATPPPTSAATETRTPLQSQTVSRTATQTPSPTATLTPVPVCAGDCGGDREVTVDEIIALVNIVLGNAAPSACPHGIPPGRDVDITLIIQSVGSALTTCPA
jgi:hypothetical protein